MEHLDYETALLTHFLFSLRFEEIDSKLTAFAARMTLKIPNLWARREKIECRGLTFVNSRLELTVNYVVWIGLVLIGLDWTELNVELS